VRNLWGLFDVLILTLGVGCLHAQQLQPPPVHLVREVVYNELHDHDHHGYWRYWIESHSQEISRLEDQVETAEGPIARLDRSNGRPLDTAGRLAEEGRLNRLLISPGEQARYRQQHVEDEERIGRVVALLPDAFLYEDAGVENGCYHMRFRPNPNFSAHSIETRIFHAMSGELWVSQRYKRLVRLDGHIEENVDFGFGILGRVYKGSWFQLQRTQVSATDWKTERIQVHINGRAILFKTIVHETSELRRGFVAVPPGMNLAQGVLLLNETELSSAAVSPASFAVSR